MRILYPPCTTEWELLLAAAHATSYASVGLDVPACQKLTQWHLQPVAVSSGSHLPAAAVVEDGAFCSQLPCSAVPSTAQVALTQSYVCRLTHLRIVAGESEEAGGAGVLLLLL